MILSKFRFSKKKKENAGCHKLKNLLTAKTLAILSLLLLCFKKPLPTFLPQQLDSKIQNQLVFPTYIFKHLHAISCGVTTMIQKL